LSTSGNLASALAPSWKQEVNQRLAAHRKGKVIDTGSQAVTDARPSHAVRASQAAARVAARFANAPSYSEMLANEARVALIAAEAATRAAQKAQAAAESVLAGLEAASTSEFFETPFESSFPTPAGEPLVRSGTHHPSTGTSIELLSQVAQRAEDQPFTIRWEPAIPVRQFENSQNHTSDAPEMLEDSPAEWREPAQAPEIDMVEPAQPIHANLIHFPRELVAAHKARPRLAEGPMAASAQNSQLSIFEVDPGAISTHPEVEVPELAVEAPAWNASEWSGIELDAQPEQEFLEDPAPRPQLEQALESASAGRRMLAVVVDFTLVVGALQVAAIVAARKLGSLPGPRLIEVGAAIALIGMGALYMILFLTLAKATPGMRYARISLCTFEGRIPTRAQRWARLVAMLLSVLPVGFGMAWAVFDDDHLCWHDRLSRTYLRRS